MQNQHPMADMIRRSNVQVHVTIKTTPDGASVQLTPGPGYIPGLEFDWGVTEKQTGVRMSTDSNDHGLVVTLHGEGTDVVVHRQKKTKGKHAGRVRVQLDVRHDRPILKVIVPTGIHADVVRHDVTVDKADVPTEDAYGFGGPFGPMAMTDLADLFGFGRNPMGNHENGHASNGNGNAKKTARKGQSRKRRSAIHS